MTTLVPAVLVPRRRARATARPRPRARSTRAASSATRCCTRSARCSTTPDLVVFCVVGDGEAETGPLATSWHCGQVPQPGPRRRGAADPRAQRVQDRQPDAAGPDPRGGAARRCCAATATTRTWSPATIPADVHQAMADRARRAASTDREIQRRRARRRCDVGRVADDRAAHAEGLDVPADRRRPAGRGHVPGPPGAAAARLAPTTSTARVLEEWLRVLPARGALRRRRAPGARSCCDFAPAGDRRMSANPVANGGSCCATSTCPTGATTRVAVDAPGATRRTRRRACSAAGCATSPAATRTTS